MTWKIGLCVSLLAQHCASEQCNGDGCAPSRATNMLQTKPVAYDDENIALEERDGATVRDPLEKFHLRLAEINAQRARGEFVAPVLDNPKISIIKSQDAPDGQTSEDLMAILQAFDAVSSDEVAGLCPGKHFLNGIAANEQGQFAADCQPCAAGCEQCYGGRSDECSKCEGDLAMLLTHENFDLRFSCVRSCPVCFSKKDGVCEMDLNCAPTAHALRKPISETLYARASAEDALVEVEEDAEQELVEEQQQMETTESSRRRKMVPHRRRRSIKKHRRRRTKDSDETGEEDEEEGDSEERACHPKVEALQDELDGWYDDCVEKLRIPAKGCEKREEVKEHVKKAQTLIRNVKAATGTGVRAVLSALEFIPWGIGSICKKIKTAAKLVNSKAVTAESKLNSFNSKLNHRTLEATCKKIMDLDDKVSAAKDKAQAKMNEFDKTCGCDCLQDIAAVDRFVAASKDARSKCEVNMPSFSIPSFSVPSMPGWIDDILAFIGDIAAKLDRILLQRHCITIAWWDICASIADVLNGISALMNLVKGIFERAITAIIDAILRTLGLPTIDEVIRWITDLIPLTIHWPSINWNIQAPSFSLTGFPFEFPGCSWSVLSCTAQKALDKAVGGKR